MNVPEAYSSSICQLEGCGITPSEIPITNVETAVRSAGGAPTLRTAVSTLVGGSYKLCNTYEDFPSYCGSSLQPILGIYATSCTANYQKGSGQNAGTSGSGSDHQ
ncbi:BnaA04g11370D [Brassica napus]|uniref:BnaA04g11370D protein n=1 Tax=Brassica napus TaxID=3708 RepID=A0A078IIX3_BRANA|nr:BnaA04g11370D [Brassica napus]